jgi:hypothetical protein
VDDIAACGVLGESSRTSRRRSSSSSISKTIFMANSYPRYAGDPTRAYPSARRRSFNVPPGSSEDWAVHSRK